MRKSSSNNIDFRINLLLSIFVFVIGTFILRLFHIQILQHESYAAQAHDQYWNLSVLPAQRGDIRSADNFVFAGTQTHYIMYVEPKKVLNKFETAHNLATVLEEIKKEPPTILQDVPSTSSNANAEDSTFTTQYDRILKILESDLYWAVVERNITPVQKEQIEKKNIQAVGFEDEPVRYYPEGSLASHVLGFVAYNEQGDKQGYFGIEGALNGDLKGKPGRVLQEQDAAGNPILIGDYKRSDAIKGRDLVLTINRSVQYMV
ncbi:hypothetical protein KAZ57_00725, partial [Patescibacteria group bacterium]|nr:hypothetical protein [Patescibacteria group bacterium]